MSDTPRTDTNSVRFSTLCADLDQWWVSRETARQLERELNAAKARIARLEEALKTCDDNFNRYGPDVGSRYGDSWQAVREALGRPNPWEHWTP